MYHPLQYLLHNDVMWLRDTGVLDKMKYDMLMTETPKPLPRVWKNEPLNQYQLGIVMIILLLGIISSIFVFVWELLRINKNDSEIHQPGTVDAMNRVRGRELPMKEVKTEGSGHVEIEIKLVIK